MKEPHREIPIKVTKWVDEGVAELVLALNDIPGVETLASCQEHPGHGLASVYFCTHDENALYETVGWLARVIGGASHDGVELMVSWGDNEGPGIADLRCPAHQLSILAEAVRTSASHMKQ